MEHHVEQAKALFRQGYNCAQSVLLAFADEAGLDHDTAARLSSSFGGGMGRLREVCGAVSAMFMIAGFRRGYTSPTDDEAKAQHYRRVQQLAAEFKAQHGTILCRDLLGLEEGPDHYRPAARTEDYYAARPCEQCIADAAAILDRWLENGDL